MPKPKDPPSKRAAKDARYYERHRAEVRERQRNYYQANRKRLAGYYRRQYWLKKIEAAQSQPAVTE